MLQPPLESAVEVSARGGHRVTPSKQSGDAGGARHLIVRLLRLFDNLQRQLADKGLRMMSPEVTSSFLAP